MTGFPVRSVKKGFGFTGTVCKQHRLDFKSELQKENSLRCKPTRTAAICTREPRPDLVDPR